MARVSLFGIAILLVITGCSPAFLNEPAPEVSAQAPDFTLETLEGESVSLSELRGQVVLLNFWATWCGPCKVEMPIIEASYNRDKLAVLAVNFNENPETVQAYADTLGLTFPILLDPGGSVQELYRVRGYPTSFFIDADGVIQIFHIGDMSEETLAKYLDYMGVTP